MAPARGPRNGRDEHRLVETTQQRTARASAPAGTRRSRGRPRAPRPSGGRPRRGRGEEQQRRYPLAAAERRRPIRAERQRSPRSGRSAAAARPAARARRAGRRAIRCAARRRRRRMEGRRRRAARDPAARGPASRGAGAASTATVASHRAVASWSPATPSPPAGETATAAGDGARLVAVGSGASPAGTTGVTSPRASAAASLFRGSPAVAHQRAVAGHGERVNDPQDQAHERGEQDGSPTPRSAIPNTALEPRFERTRRAPCRGSFEPEQMKEFRCQELLPSSRTTADDFAAAAASWREPLGDLRLPTQPRILDADFGSEPRPRRAGATRGGQGVDTWAEQCGFCRRTGLTWVRPTKLVSRCPVLRRALQPHLVADVIER